jgi:hypothetical protein
MLPTFVRDNGMLLTQFIQVILLPAEVPQDVLEATAKFVNGKSDTRQ